MRSFLNESMKIFYSPNNSNKSNISKKIKNMKLITEYSQKRNYSNNKINLKLKNFYKYDFNNILNRNNRSSKNRIKKSEPNYSSFYSRTTNNFFDSDLFLPNSPNKTKTKTEKLYKRIFSAKTNFTDDRIKSSTTQYSTKKRNNSFKKINYDFTDSNIDFVNYNIFLKKKKKKESLFKFIEKSKLVRKEKFINYFLEKKYKYEKELLEEKYNKIQIMTNSNSKNLHLMKQFNSIYDKYLDKIYIRRIKERQINAKFEMQKIELENDINKLRHKISKYKTELYNLINIKEFILFLKDRGNQNIKSRNKTNFSLLKKNLEDKVNFTYDEILSKYNKKKIAKSVIKDFKKNMDINKSTFLRRNSKKCSAKNDKNSNNKNKSFVKMKTESNIPINNINKKHKTSLIIETKINLNDFEVKKDFQNNFNNLENNILNDLEYLTEQKKEIEKLKKKLTSPNLKNNENILVASKMIALNVHKKKNKNLRNQLYLIKSNISKNQGINKKLYKKLNNILNFINKNFNINKELNLPKVFHILSLDIRNYYKKEKISKTLYIIKALENIHLFYSESIKRFLLNNVNSEKIYRNILIKYRKEKEQMNLKLIKEKNENEKIEKEKNALKKSSKIYITSHMKFNMKLYIKKKKYKKKIQHRIQKDDVFEELITYY